MSEGKSGGKRKRRRRKAMPAGKPCGGGKKARGPDFLPREVLIGCPDPIKYAHTR